MGAVCSAGTTKRSVKDEGNNFRFSGKLKTKRSFGKTKEKSYQYSNGYNSGKTHNTYDLDKRQLSFSSELKPSTPARTGVTKAPHKSSALGRAGIVGLERAVEVLDTLGSSMSNLHANGGFVSGMASRGNKISILAFEVANTIAKASNLLESLSKENVQFLKKDVLHSQGVQLLVSADMMELLSIAAADKREELDVFSREVIRFGDLCKDPQWHNLGRFFSGLDSDDSIHRQQREEAEMKMHELTFLAQHTSELYHELNALDRFEQDYRQKVEEVEALNLPRRGESLKMLHSELKQQRKLVRSLKKKSLWSRNLEEIVEKLVDIVTYAHQAISKAFGKNGVDAESSRLDSSTWSDSMVAESVLKYCILLHLSEGSNDATQFSAIYPQKSIPCITAVGYNGVQLWQNEGFISAEVLASSLEKVWLSLHLQDTTAAVLSAALASKTSEPSTPGVSTTASSDQGSSDVGGQSPLTDRYGKSPDAITEVSPDKVKEHKSDACTAEEKSFECGGVKTSSTSVDANEAGCASTDFSIEATKELPRSTVVDLDNAALLDGPHSPEKISTDSNLVVSGGGSKSMNTEVNQVERGANNEDEADKRVNRVNKSNDVYLNIRMPDGVNLQEKFSVTSTLRLVKDYIDEHHEGVIGSYDLAIPYPRNVYSDQDLSRTLSELGLFDRQALIVVPRQRRTDQSNSRNIAASSNESNEGYFARLKRLFSFINPLSYLGGGSSSTSSGQQSQHGPNSTLQNNFTQEQRPQNISSSSGNDGKNRRPTTSRSGSNIHTLKHDEDDGRFNDRNSFWNGNSTQYGGNDDGK